MLLLVAGFAAVLVGVLLLVLSALRAGGGESRVEGGAVLVVGPFPIVIGTSERATKTLVILAIALTLVVLALHVALSLLR